MLIPHALGEKKLETLRVKGEKIHVKGEAALKLPETFKGNHRRRQGAKSKRVVTPAYCLLNVFFECLFFFVWPDPFFLYHWGCVDHISAHHDMLVLSHGVIMLHEKSQT